MRILQVQAALEELVPISTADYQTSAEPRFEVFLIIADCSYGCNPTTIVREKRATMSRYLGVTNVDCF